MMQIKDGTGSTKMKKGLISKKQKHHMENWVKRRKDQDER